MHYTHFLFSPTDSLMRFIGYHGKLSGSFFSLVPVQAGNNLHFGRRKLKIEDADILVRVRIVVATWNGDQSALHVPTQDDLCCGFAVPGGNLADCRVIDHAGNALSQRSPLRNV